MNTFINLPILTAGINMGANNAILFKYCKKSLKYRACKVTKYVLSLPKIVCNSFSGTVFTNDLKET